VIVVPVTFWWVWAPSGARRLSTAAGSFARTGLPGRRRASHRSPAALCIRRQARHPDHARPEAPWASVLLQPGCGRRPSLVARSCHPNR